MENQNAGVDAPVAPDTLENGATQEVSSTTAVNEPTKRSLRVQTWKKLQENKAGVPYNSIFNRIPRFVDGDKAAELFIGTDEFKNAKHIKVNIDRALHAAKIQTLMSGKNLYLPGTRDSNALFLKVNVPEDATDEQKKDLLHVQDVQKNRIEIGLDNKVPLDIVVIGSVVVSREGHRIGRGNGFTDLDIGLLIEVGCITPDTVIVTLVHDLQVVDTLPQNLFQKYDTPVDIIVTPKEVIRVTNRLPRPTGLFWELLSERRLKIIPVLRLLRDNLLQQGKTVTIKDYDTDVEQFHNNRSRRRGPMRRRFGRRNTQRRAQSQTDTEQQQGENTQQRRFARRNRRFFTNRRRRPTKSEGDQSGMEGGKSQDRKQVSGGGNNNSGRKQRRRLRTPQRDFCIKLSNLSRDVRVKDLKSELRRRECTPLFISWKGQYGKCYLHFGNRDGTPSTEDDISKVLQSLSDLSLTVNVGGGNVGAVGADGNGTSNNNNNNNNNSSAGTAADSATNDISQNQPKTKTVNVNVELIKYDKNATTASGGNGGNINNDTSAKATTNGSDIAAGGDASGGGTRIESVDTTTI